MLEVVVRVKETGLELARVEFENLGNSDSEEFGNYAVKVGVERGFGVGMYRRGIVNFERLKFNALALVKIALDDLPEDAFKLDGFFRQAERLQKELQSIFDRE